jgi:serine/threonine-protein kinase
VLDFGIASVPASDGIHHTRTESLVGTPMFMAPEQASGSEVGPQADIWALAMCAFRLLSGHNYWQAENTNLLLAKIVYERVLPPSVKGLELGSVFDEWFVRSCARDPADRWPTVGVQVEELAAALGAPVEALVIPEESREQATTTRGVTTLADASVSEIRSNSLMPTYASTQSGASFSTAWLVVAFGVAAAAATVLSLPRQAGSPHSESRDPHAGIPNSRATVPGSLPSTTGVSVEGEALPQASQHAPSTNVVAQTTPISGIRRGGPAVNPPVPEPRLPMTRAMKHESTTSPAKEALPPAPSAVQSPPRDPLADPE